MFAKFFRPGRSAILVAALVACAACQGPATSPDRATVATAPVASLAPAAKALPPLFEDLERRSFDYFWELGNPANGLVPDRWPSKSFSSIAAVGFGLTAYGVGVERGDGCLRLVLAEPIVGQRGLGDGDPLGDE